ncbi:hypothetical protein DSO57_1036456 [Entomophthora muscae]|uniref:Uncharacterized protein n=1 Tax=Entomophthora muscae TaxID=34485 RepID=A0ACC2S1D6_9FUNG|nr:hypothetical protein DSO57_1036456 [Entomophthora muscae]
MPERLESPVEEPEPFSKFLDDVPDPKAAFEESFLPFSLNKSDALNKEVSDTASFSFYDASASPVADSNFPSDNSDNVLDLSKGYLFELEPPYFDESKNFTLLEDPLHE